MKNILLKLIITVFIFAGVSAAQNLQNEIKSFSLNILPVYESWSMKDSTSFSEFTSNLNGTFYFTPSTSASFSSQYATVGGDLNKLSGLSDVQLMISHFFKNKVVGIQAGVNIPSGKTKLSYEEFLTARVISQNLFALNTPNFGQGLNAFLGLTWTQPLSDVFVIGAGVSYQLKNEYQPLKDLPDKYNPADEFSATAGFDVSVSKNAGITGDVTGIFYGSDELDGKKVFKSGNRLITNLMYKQYFEHNVLSVNVIYRHISVDEIEGSGPVLDEEKINPSQFYSGISFHHRISQTVNMNYGIFLLLYEKTSLYFSGYTVYGIRLAPEFSIAKNISLPLFFRFALGSHSENLGLTNYQVGGGLKFNF
ncbi:MAG: hypothetical protein IPM56_01055 [Ignavibacteriales bacterium]|nr:MAG: hypothetical protein IPM56_01055 [Ignavibacteriales bacterium]